MVGFAWIGLLKEGDLYESATIGLAGDSWLIIWRCIVVLKNRWWVHGVCAFKPMIWSYVQEFCISTFNITRPIRTRMSVISGDDTVSCV